MFKREFQIPKAERERTFYGSEFEIQLKNKLDGEAGENGACHRFLTLVAVVQEADGCLGGLVCVRNRSSTLMECHRPDMGRTFARPTLVL